MILYTIAIRLQGNMISSSIYSDITRDTSTVLPTTHHYYRKTNMKQRWCQDLPDKGAKLPNGWVGGGGHEALTKVIGYLKEWRDQIQFLVMCPTCN